MKPGTMESYILERARRLALEARNLPATCQVSRAWLARARHWACSNGRCELRRALLQVEEDIL